MAEDSQLKQFVQNFLLAGTVSAFSKLLVAPPETYSSLYFFNNADGTNYFTEMLKKKGKFELWRYSFPKIPRYSLSQALNFAFYDLFKKEFCSHLNPKTDFSKFSLSHMAAGAAAGGTSLLIMYPQHWKKSIHTCAKMIPRFSKEEILKQYKWFGISAAGAMVYRSVLLGGYETAKKLIFREEKDTGFFGKYFRFIGKYLMAVGVSLLAVLLSNPIDVVRSRMVMGSKSLKSDNSPYKGAFDCAKRIHNEQGWKRFMIIRSLSWVSIISSSLNLVLYDELQRYLFPEKLLKL